MKKILSALVITGGLSACATSTLSVDDTQQYKDADVYTFVKQRFVETEQNSLFSAIDSGLSSLSSLSSNKKSESTKKFEEYEKNSIGLMPDGRSAIFEAAFNQMDNSQLLRPKSELVNFCEIKGGLLVVDNEDIHNFIQASYARPLTAFENILAEDIEGIKSKNPTFVPTAKSVDDYTPLIKMAATLQERYSRKAYDQENARNAYAYAEMQGAFGSFMCIDKLDKKPLWSVIIAPFTYESATRDYSAHALKIFISPDKGQ